MNTTTTKANGRTRRYRHPVTLETATLTVNLDTLVVVLRRGSWDCGADPAVCRAQTLEQARAAWARFDRETKAAGLVQVDAR